jgi:hypothetical protein
MIAEARLPLSRLARTPRAWVPIALWIGVAVLGAFVVHGRGGMHASDSALLGAYSDIALPLLAYAVVSATLAGESLTASGKSLVAFGAHPAMAALSSVVVATVTSALLAAATGAVVVLVTHSAGDPPLGADVFTTSWASLLGGMAYATYFAFGASFGSKGGGRAFLLALDWLLGSGHGLIAALLPRAHLRSLLGGEPALAFSQTASIVVLLGLTLLFGALAVLRARR